MQNVKRFLSKDILIVVFVNLFLANMYPLGFFIALYFAIPFLFEEHRAVILECMFILALFLPMIRLIWLPILYTKMEKYSKNELVQELIYNLKNNSQFRWGTIFAVELPWICYYIYLIIYKLISNFSAYVRYDDIGWISSINLELYWYGITSYLSQILIRALILFIFFNLSFSYLVLFLWWKIRGELK